MTKTQATKTSKPNVPVPTAPPAPSRAKKPRTKSTKSGQSLLPPGFVIPRRKEGPPIKVVPRAARQPGDPDPFLKRFFADPSVLLQVFANRPTWVDDFAAIILISFGMVSLLALLSNAPVTSTSLSDLWADFISQLVGRVGAALLSLMLIGAGALIVLPRLNITIRVTWRRFLALEVAYLGLLALLHLLANDPEPRALARSGQGGGFIGWALAEIAARLFGSGLATLVYFLIIVFALGLTLGIRRTQIRKWVIAFSKRLEVWAESLKKRATTPRPPGQPDQLSLLRTRLKRFLGREGAHGKPHVKPLLPDTASGTPDALPAPSQAASIRSTATSTAAPPPVQPVESGEPVTPVPIRRTVTTAGAPSAPMAAQPAEAEEFTPPTPSTPVRPAPIRRTTSTPMRPAQVGEPTGSRPVPIGSALSAHETEPEPPLPAPVAPPRPAAIAPRGSTPISTPAVPERRTRYFTVEDFKEVRQTYPREGLPPLPLLSDTELNKPTEQEINNNVRIIENTLLEFDIDVEVVDVRVGPTVTQYAVQPFREVTNDQGETVTQRVRVNKISSLGGDLALALAAKRLRIQPYVPGHPYMGIEVPNHTPSVVALRPVMESEVFARAFLKPDPELPNQNREMPLVVPLGRDVSGEAVVVDLATMPHMLIAGTTGSGKSVCITAMITALMMNNLPDRVKLILLDPKMVELSRFNGLPHLLGPVETDIERIIGVLRWATREMDRRYKLLEVEAARNIEVYNRALGKRRKAEHLPYVVILVDEIGDLMLSRPEEMEHTVTRLAQMARAVGMHLVIATQRPSTDVITGLIKANFPARISFAVASGVDSRVILDTTGAESLIGRGDMLYLAPDAGAPRRVQGCFVADSEIEALVNYWKRWQAEKEITGDTPPMEIAPWERGITRRESYSDTDAMLEDAIDLVVREGEASTSLIQRRLGIAYPRAAQLMDLISELGILGATKEDGRTREVTMKPGTDPYKKLIAKYRKLR